MAEYDAYACCSKYELREFISGVKMKTIRGNQNLFYSPPHVLSFQRSLATDTMPFFRWMSERRSGSFLKMITSVLVGRNFLFKEYFEGNDQKTRELRQRINDDELIRLIEEVFDQNYVLGKVFSDQISFYQND